MTIPNEGKLKLLDSQRTYLAGLKWGLFTNNIVIGNATTFVGTPVTEAAWAGYARVTAGTWGAPVIVANKAVSIPNAAASFGNTSGVGQNFYGWFLIDDSGGAGHEILIGGLNIGLTVLAAGGNYPLAASITDDQQ
jgi:hypothetical protein